MAVRPSALRLSVLAVFLHAVEAVQVQLEADRPGGKTCRVLAPSPPKVKGVKFDQVTKVLVFWAVGSGACSQSLVKASVDHLRAFERASKNVHVDVFLVHYDSQRNAWHQNLAYWYQENVNFSAESPGLKLVLAAELLVGTGESRPNLKAYSWVWLLDEDALITQTDLGQLLQDADESGSLIVAPSILFPNNLTTEAAQTKQPVSQARRSRQWTSCRAEDDMCQFEAPHPGCRYRHTNFLEVSFPLLRPAALQALRMAKVVADRESVWGVDHVWCSLVPKLLRANSSTSNFSCSILDRNPLVHWDLRTHPKYISGSENVIQGLRAAGRLKSAYPNDYIGERSTLECVK